MIKELGLTFKNIIMQVIRILSVLFIIATIIMFFMFEKDPLIIIPEIIIIVVCIIVFQLCNPKFWERVKARKENKE